MIRERQDTSIYGDPPALAWIYAQGEEQPVADDYGTGKSPSVPNNEPETTTAYGDPSWGSGGGASHSDPPPGSGSGDAPPGSDEDMPAW